MVHYARDGFCPCCERRVTFASENAWYRDFLLCSRCGSLVRERAVALVIGEIAPNWRDLRIHESSPSDRGVSVKFRKEAKKYTATQFYPGAKRGEMVGRFRNEDLERQTFEDELFDIVVTLDVMEHVFEPELVYQEIFRTLKPGGYYLHTFPIKKEQTQDAVRRAAKGPDDAVVHIVEPPEYHGNPIDSKGSLVTFDYGYDVSQRIAAWAPFNVRIIRFWDEWHGVMGEFTEVVVCRKPLAA